MVRKIQSKLTELRQTKERLVAQLNSVVGAENVLLELLGEEESDHGETKDGKEADSESPE